MSSNKCLNLSGNPEIFEYSEKLNMDPAVVQAKITTWMNKNNTDALPTLEQFAEYMGIEESPITTDISKETEDLLEKNAHLKKDNDFNKKFNAFEREEKAIIISDVFSSFLDALEEEYKNQGNPLTRKEVINTETPVGIFTRVLNFFQYAKENPEMYYWNEEQVKQANDIIENFYQFADLATRYILQEEGLDIRIDGKEASEIENSAVQIDPETGEAVEDTLDDIFEKEESPLEGWQVKHQHLSAKNSLSKEVRSILSKIKKIGFDGQPETNSLGFPKRINSDLAHNILIDKLRFMDSDADLIPMLKELAQQRKWVEPIITLLEENPSLKSKFYSDFRKDFNKLRVVKRKVSRNGSFYFETVDINKPMGIEYLHQEWSDNYFSGTQLISNSIYNTNGTVNRENVDKLKADTQTLLTKMSKETNRMVFEEAAKWTEENIESIGDIFKAIGISGSSEEFLKALNTNPNSPDSKLKYYHPLHKILKDIAAMAHTTKAQNIGVEKGKEIPVDWIKEFKNTFNNIADVFSKVVDDAIESSVYENGKSYYSHQVPNYLNSLIKNLRRTDPEAFDRFMKREFGRYHQFFDFINNEYKEGWIKDLAENETDRQLLDVHTMLNFNKVDYAKLSELDYTIAMIQEFFATGNKTSGNYHVPIVSDSPAGLFIRFKRYDNGKGSLIPTKDGQEQHYKDFLGDKLTEVSKQELERIKLVRARNESIQDNSVIKKIQNFDKNGDKFIFFPALNEHLDTILELSNSKEEAAPQKLDKLIKSVVMESMEKEFNKALLHWDSIGLFEVNPENNILNHFGNTREQAETQLENYFWNSAYATTQIINMTNGDLAMFASIEDFQKRNKQIYSPTMKLDSSSRYGKKELKTVLIKDSMVTSNSLLNIQEVFRGIGMPKHQIGQVLEAYYAGNGNGVNQTDGQGYGSLASFRAIEDMAGRWNDRRQEAYDKLLDYSRGRKDVAFTTEDFNTLISFQPMKPFVYTQRGVKSGIKDAQGNDILIKTPFQNKNSLYMLTIAGLMGRSPKVVAMNRFMMRHNIDIVQFDSSVKVGGQGVVDINNFETAEEIVSHLERSTGLRKEALNPALQEQTVHAIPIEDFGIQQPVDDKLSDKSSLFGSQIRKLITADMPDNPNFRIEVNGKKYTKHEWFNKYNDLIVENIIDSFVELKQQFSSNKEIEKILLAEVRGNPRYGRDFEKAITLNKDGEFPIPIYDPTISNKMQQLLSSVIKTRVTKQKIKGGSVVQLSNFGFDENLSVRFKDKNGKLIPTETEWLRRNKKKTREDYKQYIKESQNGIAYYEAYMPAYSKLFFDELMDPDTGQIQPSMLPEELRKMIGYRIPTEDKYSMFPIYIKGFLPASAGAAIMLPADITSITGGDFDIDKIYLMIPEFRVQRYNMDRARKDYKRLYGVSDTLLDDIFEDIDDITGDDQFKEFFAQNKGNYELHSPQFKKIYYNDKRGAEGNSLLARNNEMVDMIWGVLTNQDTASKMLNPQNFDAPKRAAAIVTILERTDLPTLKDAFGEDFMKVMEQMPLKELTDISNSLRGDLNILNPTTQTYFHKQNMTAAQLIGIAANHNANHGLMQWTRIRLADHMAFTLNGKKLTSLHSIKNSDGDYISRNNATYLAASVDAVKDPVLDKLNINTFTADMVFTLSRLGHSPMTIGLFFKQPAINSLINYYTNNKVTGKSKNQLITEFISRYINENKLEVSNIEDQNISNQDLIEGLLDRSNSRAFHQGQLAALQKFVQIFNAAVVVGDLTAATRSDTQGGAAGPTIAMTESKMNKLKAFLNKNVYTKKPTVIGGEILDPFLDLSDTEVMTRETKTKTPLKDQYKGKLIFAQSGTGKTTIADNTNVIDSDTLFAQILNVPTPLATAAFNALDSEAKGQIVEQYKELILDTVKRGKTVITANLSVLDHADVVVMNESAELTDKRTSSEDRTNKYLDSEHQQKSLRTLNAHIAQNPNKEVHRLSDGQYLANVLLTDPDFNLFEDRIQKNELNDLIEDFLDEFGIEFKVDEYQGSEPIFNVLDKIVSARSREDIPESAGEAIAYMMQYHPLLKGIIADMAIEEGKATTEEMYAENGNIKREAFKDLDKEKYLKIISKKIGEQLRDLHNEKQKTPKTSLAKKIWQVIQEFFSMMTPKKKEILAMLDHASNVIATQVLYNNPYFIKATLLKPGDEQAGIPRQVNLAQALDQNPYERGILIELSKHGMTLTGSAAFSVQGTTFRPEDNPLHDLDFVSTKINDRDSLTKVLEDTFENVEHVRTIQKEGEVSSTETYLTMSVPFTMEESGLGDDFMILKDKNTGEVIGNFINSNLVITKEGINGKFLDFFMNDLKRRDTIDYEHGGHQIKLSDYRDAFAKKLEYARLKDIWDYNRFIPETFVPHQERKQASSEYKFNHPVTKIISGGQTGVDVAGLDVGLEIGIPTGGTAAAGFQQSTEGNKKIFNLELATKYGLKEGAFTEKQGKFGPYKDPYYQRTIDNAQEADGTIWFGNPNSPGGKLTLGSIAQKGKPAPLINPKTPEQILKWLNENNIQTLNIAGNREHTNPGIYETAKNLLKAALSSRIPQEGQSLSKMSTEEYKSKLREQFKRSDLPFLQAFYSLGLQSSELLLGDKFPYFRSDFRYIMDVFRDMTYRGELSDKTVNKIYTDLITYIMSGTEFLGATNLEQYKEKYYQILEQFPHEFAKLQESDALKNNPFIQSLKVQPPNKQYAYSTIVFRNSGKLSADQIANLQDHWNDLLYSPETKDIALKLFQYGNMRNGLGFAPDSFTHFASTLLKLHIPQYISQLERILREEDAPAAYSKHSKFIHQFLRNNPNLRELIPLIDETFGDNIYDEDGNLKDVIEVYSPSPDNTFQIKELPGVRKFKIRDDGRIVDFKPYVSIQTESGEQLYQLVSQTDRKAQYQLTSPLGSVNHHKQYLQGYTAQEIAEGVGVMESQRTEEDLYSIFLDGAVPEMSDDALGMQRIIEGYHEILDNETPADLANAQVVKRFTAEGLMVDPTEEQAPPEPPANNPPKNDPLDFDPDAMAAYWNLEGEIESIMKELRAYGRDGNYRRFIKYNEIEKIINKFNKNHPLRGKYVASAVRGYHRGDDFIFYRIQIKPRTKLNAIEATQLEHNEALNAKIREVLAKHGVSVGALTALETRQKIAGVMDTTQAKEAADGLLELIRIAHGDRGEKVLPEEFAHFVVEAMGDDPLVKRLLNLVNQNNHVQEILGSEFEEYNKIYEGDNYKLAKEAAGKLLAKHFLQNEQVQPTPYKNLLQRVIGKIKQFFTKLFGDDLSRARYQLDAEFNKVAKGIMEGAYENIINIQNIVATPGTQKLYNLGQRINRDRELLKRMVETETKLFYIAESKRTKRDELQDQKAFIEKLNNRLERNDRLEELAGIQEYLSHVVEKLAELETNIQDIYNKKNTVADINDIAGKLREANDFYQAYVGVLDQVKAEMNESKLKSETRFDDKVKAQVSEALEAAGMIFDAYNSLSKELFASFLEPFLGPNVRAAYLKKFNKEINLKDLLKESNKDISMMARWLESMSRVNDLPSQLIDAVVKKQRTDARMNAIEVAKKLQAAQLKMEKAGVKNTEWIFERDENGVPTGKYITEVDSAAYFTALHKFRNELEQKYPGDENIYARSVALSNWYEENREFKDGAYRPVKAKYPSKQFANLNTAQKEFYKTFMGIKEELDALLPEGTTSLNHAVQMRKDFLERVMQSKNLKEGIGQIVDNIKDAFIQRIDDTDFGEVGIVKTVSDFEGKEVSSLPIYYIKELEDKNALSLDATSTMMAYAHMAHDFSAMNQVINALELGRDILRRRDVNKTVQDNPMMERFKHMGRVITSKINKKGDESQVMQRLNDYYSMQVYSRYIKDQGTIKGTKLSIAKLADLINRWTSLLTTAMSFFVSSTNLLTGISQTNIEVLAGQHFNAKDLFRADKNYGKGLPALLGEIGNRVKTSKLALVVEMFNTTQDAESELKHSNMDRKNWLSRMFSMSSLHFMSTSGEHWLHTRVVLAMMERFKMKTPQGKTVSLYDALEPVYIDPKNKSLGARLQIKPGYKKLDGTEFTNSDLNDIVNRSSHVNHLLHGVYNKADRDAAQAIAQGRLIEMFRKWMYTAYTRRYGRNQFNVELDMEIEGYYNSLFKFLHQLGKDAIRGKFIWGSRFNALEGYQKANFLRAVVDATQMLIISSLLGFIDWGGDDDKSRKRRSWLSNAIEYQLRRERTELMSMAPIPGGMPEEGWRILQSPMAGMTLLNNLFDLVNVTTWGKEIKRGRYAGRTRFERTVGQLIPLNKTIYGIFHPEERILFYTREMR